MIPSRPTEAEVSLGVKAKAEPDPQVISAIVNTVVSRTAGKLPCIWQKMPELWKGKPLQGSV